MTKQLTIGLFGYGCVGSGLYEVLQRTPDFNAEIRKICVKNKNKERNLPSAYFTYDKNDLLDDETINVIVELIDDAEEAFNIVSAALKKGKAVVTANKKMLAQHFEELYQLQQTHQVPLLYEASVGGSIPIIRSLEEYYDNDTLSNIEGVLNGTTNYILTKTFQENKSYEEVLLEAQQLGFAESDPTLDVQAFDPKFKLAILLAHTFGIVTPPEAILNYGIHNLGVYDTRFAREKGYAIKLIAEAAKVNNTVKAYVLPRFIKQDNAFYHVNNEFNAVQVTAAFSDTQLLKGKGAGSFPTAAAVLSDLSALRYNYSYGYKKIKQDEGLILNQEALVRIYLRYHDEAIFDLLDFQSIEEELVSKTYKYIIGTISIQQLLEANLNEIKNVFVAEIGVPAKDTVGKKQLLGKQDLFESIH